MDTRTRIYLLIDFKEYYGIEGSISDAIELIRDIPSETLLNYISGFGVNLYLHENTEHTGKIQFMLVDSLLAKCSQSIQQKWVSEVKRQAENGHAPIMFWSYSNLLFYGLIFKIFNNISSRDLTDEEAKKVFDAYLIINGIANNRVKIEAEEIKNAEEAGKIEDVVMPNFIYQRDYASSLDFSNQVTRGVSFFQYLESDPKYSSLVHEYYMSKNVSGYLRMFKNLMVIFSEVKLGMDSERRCQLANLQEYFVDGEVDLAYIETLCINIEVSTYVEDESFSVLRNRFIYKLNRFQYLILDINFLLDQFYKAQIFSFNAFLKAKGIKGEFLSEKGKNFTENIYLPLVLDTCFPHLTRFYGDNCVNSDMEELCDAYLRESNKICLIEFKDVLLSAAVKNSANKDKLLAEFDKKFVANQTNKPKGITQLLNAIKDIDENSISFDNTIPKQKVEIYPVLVYTDLSFGIEGVNKKFKEKFNSEILKFDIQNIIVKDITFVNLNFFELHEDYFSKKLLNIFHMLDSFHEHTLNQDYALTSFEIFSRFFMNRYVTEDLGSSASYLQQVHNIVTAK